MRVSEIRVNQIRVNQGLGVLEFDHICGLHILKIPILKRAKLKQLDTLYRKNVLHAKKGIW